MLEIKNLDVELRRDRRAARHFPVRAAGNIVTLIGATARAKPRR